MLQYKIHILGILESVTAGIYHAGVSVLAPLDRLQTTFVHNFNIDVTEAFMRYNLAPLALRRDIAMLGFLHKCNMPDAPAHMKRLLPGRTGKRLWNILSFNRRVFHPDLAKKSKFNSTTVYNALPHYTRSLESVQEFQHELIEMTRRKIRHGHDDWEKFLLPRHFDEDRGIHLP